MKFTEHEDGMSFKLDTIEQTLSVYLQWEGIIGYDYMILEMKGWSEDDIDDVLREEGIYGFSRDIYTILQGKSAFCAGMELEDFLNVCREQGIDVSGEKPDISIATESSGSSNETPLRFSVWPEYSKEDLTNTIIDTLISSGISYHSAKKLAGNYYITIIGDSNTVHKAKIIIESLVFFKEWIQESSVKPAASSSKPQKGDKVVVSYYQHPNNGLKGVVTSKVGNLCWVKTDEYGTMTFIDTFLDKIDESSSTEQMHAGPVDYIKNDLSRAKIKYSFDDEDTFSFDNYDDMRQAEEIICQVVGENYNKSNNSISINLEETADESFKDDFNKKVLQDSLANKNKPTKEYNIGSNKLVSQTGDTRTLNRLKKLAEQLERDSELGFKYVIEDGYEDVGANMRWTSIAAVRPDGSSHWAISPGEWVTLANGDDDSIVDVVQASIQSDEFFQDKKEKEPMTKRVITSAKEDYEQASLKMDKFMSDDVLDRFYSAKTEEELVNILEDGIIDYDKFYSYAGKNASVNGFARYLFNSKNSAKEAIEDYDILDRYRFNGDYLERSKYLIFDILDKGALPGFIEQLRNMGDDVTEFYEDTYEEGELSNYTPGTEVYDINGTLFFVQPEEDDVYTVDDDPEGTFYAMLEDDGMRKFLEDNGLILELEEDEIRDNLGLDPLEDEEEDDDGETDDYSAEEGLSDGKDYVVKLKCNDNPFHTVKFISESDDIDEIIAIAKKYYEHNYVTYADDRKNEWIIDEILENGKIRGVPIEYTSLPLPGDEDINNAFEDYSYYSVAANLSMQIDEAESDEDLEEVLYAIESAYEDGDITEEEYNSLKEDLGEK